MMVSWDEYSWIYPQLHFLSGKIYALPYWKTNITNKTMENHWKTMELVDVYPLVSSNMAGKSPNSMEISSQEHHTCLNVPFSSNPCLITGRCIPSNPIKPQFSYCFPMVFLCKRQKKIMQTASELPGKLSVSTGSCDRRNIVF